MKYILANKIQSVHGRSVLVSYAQYPIWKSYNELLRQSDTPGVLESPEAERVLKKYGHKDTCELLTYEAFEQEFKAYIQTK